MPVVVIMETAWNPAFLNASSIPYPLLMISMAAMMKVAARTTMV